MRHKIKFKIAHKNDTNAIFQVFVDAIKEMNAQNIPQWDAEYPSRAVIEEDINNRELYVGRMGQEIVSVYVLNQSCDDQYFNGIWKYPSASFYVIHRLCVNPKYMNQGMATETMEHIEEVLKARGTETIRLDAFSLNPYALKLYDKLGYEIVGVANWRKGKFYLMEKRL